MVFFQKHWAALLFAISLSAILKAFRPSLDRLFSRLGTPSTWPLRGMAGAAFLLFYFFFYFSRPVYYTPYWGGVTGDNYNFSGQAIENPRFFLSNHVFHPWVVGQGLKVAQRFGWMRWEDPNYIEKAFTKFSLPSRILAFVAGFFAFLILRRMGLQALPALIGTFFLYTTFGYWFWSLQSSSIGVVIPFSVIALWSVIEAIAGRRVWMFALAGLLTSLCVYIHISSFFITVGLALAVTIFTALQCWKDRSGKPLVSWAAFAAPAILLAYTLYEIAVLQFGTRDFWMLMNLVANYGLLGKFKFSFGIDYFERLMGDCLVLLAYIMGLVPEPGKTRLERLVIELQFAILLLIAISGWSIRWRVFFSWRTNPVLLTILVVMVTCILGFALRETWYQYLFSLAAVTAVGLVAFALYPERSSPATGQANTLLLVLMSASLFYTNGFGTTNVFRGEKVDSDPVYQTLQTLVQTPGDEPVIYNEPLPGNIYNSNAILAYFKWSPKFRRIIWNFKKGD